MPYCAACRSNFTYIAYITCFSFEIIMNQAKEFFCIECNAFLPENRFNKNGGRIMCAFHDNKKRDYEKMLNPMTKKARIIWHVAYNDAVRKFKTKSKISYSQVKEILSKYNIPHDLEVRLLPANPLFPVSPTNFCLTSLSARKEIVSFWIRTHSFDAYCGYIGTPAKRPVYGMCNEEQLSPVAG
jgi:hypothetical protein